MSLWILTGATLLLAIATGLPLLSSEKWWIRGWDFPRLQLAVLLALLLITQVVVPGVEAPFRILLLLINVVLLGYQLWWILPYTPLWKPEVEKVKKTHPKSRLKVLAANVLTPNPFPEKLLECIKKYSPDIFVTLETDKRWEMHLNTLEKLYPFSIKYPLDNLYGMHVYSRLKLRQPRVAFLVDDTVPSIHAEVLMDNGVPVRMHFLHPTPPSPTENERSLERDVELLMIANSLKKYDGPAVVTGDLNDVAWSETTRLFRRISGLLDPRVGRGMFNTFHADYPFLRWPLDHLFHTHHFSLVNMQRLPHIGSDHFPVLIELCYRGEHTDQEGLEEDDEDQQKAEEKIRKQEAE